MFPFGKLTESSLKGMILDKTFDEDDRTSTSVVPESPIARRCWDIDIPGERDGVLEGSATVTGAADPA
jgi:hypothetical protein